MKTFFECPISIADAALGTSIEIPTIDGGKAKLKFLLELKVASNLDYEVKECLI